jgi:hypothetical protein
MSYNAMNSSHDAVPAQPDPHLVNGFQRLEMELPIDVPGHYQASYSTDLK